MVREQTMNHVEPFPLRNALVTHAGNDLVQTAPASASAAPMLSDSEGVPNCSTCRKKEFARRV